MGIDFATCREGMEGRSTCINGRTAGTVNAVYTWQTSTGRIRASETVGAVTRGKATAPVTTTPSSRMREARTQGSLGAAGGWQRSSLGRQQLRNVMAHWDR